MIRRGAFGGMAVGLVFSVSGCTQALVQNDECVLGDSSGARAVPTDAVPRSIEPADRIASPEVRAYLANRLQELQVVASTVTRRGQAYDWIDPQTQVPGGVIASPPPLDPRPGAGTPGDACTPTLARGELEEEPDALGPPGTVPVLHIDPDRIHAPGTVADFLSKYGDAADIPPYAADGDIPPPQVGTEASHYYARSQMFVNNHGGEGYFNVWSPFAVVPSEMSLAQIGVARMGHPTLPSETVEAGWHVLGSIYGDFSPRLFVYFTTTGYKAGGNGQGGYNMSQTGWVQVSRTITPGTILTSVSVLGGEQVEFYLRVELHEGKWWIRYNDEFVGYYPASLFAQDGLGTQGNRVTFFGETFDDPNVPGMTVTDMGSGKFPGLDTWKRSAAYLRYLQYQPTADGSTRTRYLPNAENGKAKATNPKCYNITANFDANDEWQSQCYFGGPGQNPDCP